MLRDGSFGAGFSRMHECLVVPIDSSFLQLRRNDDAILLEHEYFVTLVAALISLLTVERVVFR